MVIFSDQIKANAVIFDFDGVIVDTEPLHYKAFQRILEPQGLGFSWQEYIETYMGFDDRDAFREAYTSKGKPLDSAELGRLVAEKAIVFQDVIQDGVTAYPGVVELIKKLNIINIPMAICSGALLSDIVPILTLLGISNCFQIIVTADDVSKSKPDPECYRLAYEKVRKHWPDIEITLSSTVAIEDTPAGIQSATGASLKVIAVTNSYAAENLQMAAITVKSLSCLIDFEELRA
jgi:beta-phosphoglucomutase